jgi:hypothetical protein
MTATLLTACDRPTVPDILAGHDRAGRVSFTGPGCWAASQRSARERALHAGNLDLTPVITHRTTLDEGLRAYEIPDDQDQRCDRDPADVVKRPSPGRT